MFVFQTTASKTVQSEKSMALTLGDIKKGDVLVTIHADGRSDDIRYLVFVNKVERNFDQPDRKYLLFNGNIEDVEHQIYKIFLTAYVGGPITEKIFYNKMPVEPDKAIEIIGKLKRGSSIELTFEGKKYTVENDNNTFGMYTKEQSKPMLMTPNLFTGKNEKKPAKTDFRNNFGMTMDLVQIRLNFGERIVGNASEKMNNTVKLEVGTHIIITAMNILYPDDTKIYEGNFLKSDEKHLYFTNGTEIGKIGYELKGRVIDKQEESIRK